MNRTNALKSRPAAFFVIATTVLGAIATGIFPPSFVGAGERVAASKVATSTSGTQKISADQALEILKAGNKRFVAGKPRHPHETPKWRHRLTTGQKPIATILGCSDSRVTPELIFDEGLGDLFVIRVAGNIVDEDVTASIEYAVEHLDTHLVVVLGHENCGAVTAALESDPANTVDNAKPHHHEPRELQSLVSRLHDHLFEHCEGEPDVESDTNISTAVCKNVMCSCRHLHACGDLEGCMERHQVKLVGAIYDLDTGKVRWLD